ncbi:MAG: HNH endonuclease, partial [Bacteroidota bacterium]
MTFSVNLTTEKESENIIFMTQKIKFAERYEGDEKLAQAHRRQKQIVLCEIYKKIGLEVTENNDLILGIFDPTTKQFVNTSAEKFLNDFIAVSLLKGHFQGNKGYELEILPSFKNTLDVFNSTDDEIEELPHKIVEQKGKRSIPLALRYKVFKRDDCKCIACGRNAKNGVILHVDHKIPYSLGGLSTLDNLQTLCQECNISKSNKFIDK